MGILAQLAASYDDSTNVALQPVAWCKDRAHISPWAAQRAIARSVVTNRHTAVHACFDSGKSFIASALAAWWVDSHPVGSAFVVTTAPTTTQVRAIIWQGIGKVHAEAGLKGHINRGSTPEWFIGDTQVGIGRHPAEHMEAAFQGIHSEYLLAIIDEASGVSRQMFDAVDALATNENSRVLAIGNPDDPRSHFAQVCEPDSGWHVIHIDGLRTPNMTTYQMVKYPLLAALMRASGIEPSTRRPTPLQAATLLSPRWVEERIVRWAGVDPSAKDRLTPDELAAYVLERTQASQLFVAKVRGNFPPEAGLNMAVIPLGWYKAAVARWYAWAEAGSPQRSARPYVGVDVARGGADRSAKVIRRADIVERIDRADLNDTMAIADWASADLYEPGSLAIVDVIGVGAGVLDGLRRKHANGEMYGNAVAFNASAQSNRRDITREFKFANDRSAAWWAMREALDPSRSPTLALPPDDDLMEELTTPMYQVKQGGIIQVEGKDQIKKRLGRSTDSADAVIQSLWIDDTGIDLEIHMGVPDPIISDLTASWTDEGW